jgi:hypothetical protein
MMEREGDETASPASSWMRPDSASKQTPAEVWMNVRREDGTT